MLLSIKCAVLDGGVEGGDRAGRVVRSGRKGDLKSSGP